MVAAVAGSPISALVDAKRVAALRQSGKVVYPEDLGFAAAMPPAPCWPPAASPTGGVVRRTVQPTGKIPELVMKISPCTQKAASLAGAYRQRLSD